MLKSRAQLARVVSTDLIDSDDDAFGQLLPANRVQHRPDLVDATGLRSALGHYGLRMEAFVGAMALCCLELL